jgi:hypothetical protein
MITPKIARTIYEQHEEYWNDRRPEMRRLRNAYLMRYWQRNMSYDESLLIETSRAYELIESFVASLFVRDPSVVVKPDLRGRGDPELAEEVSNNWLLNTRREIEDALRQSLIYPWSAMKLTPSREKDVLRRVEMTAVGPWDIIVDDAASSWQTQRYVGHRYFVPLEEAKKKYGNKKYAKRSFTRYIDYQDEPQMVAAYRRDEDPVTNQIDDFVLVVEFYDLVKERMLVWSPDYAEGKKFLYDGIELDVGVEGEPMLEKFDGIPFRTASDKPIIPIVPLYMSRQPDEPLRGYSALRRVYDQVVEVNTIRTFQANGIRRAARQWMVEKGVLDEEAMSKIAQGQDGEFIEIELSPGQSLNSAIAPVPHNPVPTELQVYEQQVEDDFGRGSILAPFTRGEATKATATEITALAAYSASEIGRMARERDAAIAQCAQTYCVMIATLMGDETELVRLGGKAKAVQADDLIGDFGFFAQDSGSTPMSEAVKKQELMNLIPVLQALGVANQTILKSLVRVYGLSEEFLPKDIPTPPTPQPPAPGSDPMAAMNPQDALPSMGVAPGEMPSPGSVRAVLPDGNVI